MRWTRSSRSSKSGRTWRDVIKVTKYLTDFREADAMHKTMAAYFGDWLPASTTVCINQLSSPGARIELDMIVALPKSAGKYAAERKPRVPGASSSLEPECDPVTPGPSRAGPRISEAPLRPHRSG